MDTRLALIAAVTIALAPAAGAHAASLKEWITGKTPAKEALPATTATDNGAKRSADMVSMRQAEQNTLIPQAPDSAVPRLDTPPDYTGSVRARPQRAAAPQARTPAKPVPPKPRTPKEKWE